MTFRSEIKTKNVLFHKGGVRYQGFIELYNKILTLNTIINFVLEYKL